jgi:copper homeostasis protein
LLPLVVKMILEIACFNLESCLIAQKAGANRIEFCHDYSIGGITPSRQEILQARKQIHIPLHVIIRPRAGDYFYNEKEIDQMKLDIIFCKENKIDGVVFGILTKEKEIATENSELIALGKPMSCNFHRAIDECRDIFKSVEDLIKLGFDRTLTTGTKANALEGKEIIEQLQQTFGNKIKIMPGGGIRSANVSSLFRTNCTEFHSAAITQESTRCDENEIKKLIQKINSR